MKKVTASEARKMIIDGDAPDNLSVGGSLDLRGTGITALPDNLSVGGWLDLSRTGITALPDNLSVGGSLDLSRTGITALPDNLSVGGWLDLSGTGITAIWTDDRGYKLYPAPKSDGTIRWVAGCRFFQSTADALAHWGADDYPSPDRGAAFCRAIRSHERAAQ